MKTTDKIERSLMIDMCRKMILIREFEEETYLQYMKGKIKGFLHVYSGQEAIAVGVLSALRDDDYVITHYRDHGHAIARNMDTKSIMAELFGKSTGCSSGKGGSMHLFDKSLRFMGGHAIVGGQIPIATGIGLGINYKSEDSVVICFLGDGALNEGGFHESMNLSAVWKLPVIFLCENNLYGMGAAASATIPAHDEIYKIAEAYKIPGRQVDGMDVIEMRKVGLEASQYVRNGGGPIFLEALTYRYRGHSVSDPAEYRSHDQLKSWMTKDPIITFPQKLIEEGSITNNELEEIRESVKKEISEAVQFATESPFPEPSELYQDVYEG